MSQAEEKQDTLQFQSNAELRISLAPPDSLSFFSFNQKKSFLSSASHDHAGPWIS